MSKIVEINPNASVTAPYTVYVCDSCSGGAICQFVDITSSDPFQFTLPSIYESYASFSVKIIDAQGCIICETYTF